MIYLFKTETVQTKPDSWRGNFRRYFGRLPFYFFVSFGTGHWLCLELFETRKFSSICDTYSRCKRIEKEVLVNGYKSCSLIFHHQGYRPLLCTTSKLVGLVDPELPILELSSYDVPLVGPLDKFTVNSETG